jgi:galactokinase
MNERASSLMGRHGELFGERESVRLFRAPGRVNLIGEHTDYNDGFVFPVAIDRDIQMAVSPRDDSVVSLHAMDYGNTETFDLDHMDHAVGAAWAKYPKGVAAVLQGEGLTLRGFDAVFNGTVPLGAGLSSSAALEVATATLMCGLSGIEIPGPRLARLCQRAENEYAGVQCGIMDQFISSMAESDTALMLDCRSLAYEHVPLRIGDHILMIANTNKPRGLVDSEYNNRRQECEEGVRLLQKSLPETKALRDVTTLEFGRHRTGLTDQVAHRCQHVIEENERVELSVKALKQDDLSAFGKLMNASHDSLRDLYEVSCYELDLMVDIARSCSGVLGSRMTGGGFGGCTVTLVSSESVGQLETSILDQYPAATGFEPELYVCRPSAGANELI